MPSANGSEVPKVTVSLENDMQLKPSGKLCARAGMPNLPGGLLRSYSSSRVYASPGGWLEAQQQRMATHRREYQDRLNETSSMSHAMATGTWGDQISSMRSSTSAFGGGRTQGAGHLRTHTTMGHVAVGDRPASSSSTRRWSTGAEGFRYCIDARSDNRERHGWHDPRGQAEARRLVCPKEPGSYAWMMRKARDHVGYGDDGIVNIGDVQVSAVSEDSPTWFLGPRTIPGPQNTKTLPVRRCPWVKIEGKEVRVRAKSFRKGDGLSTIETLHDGQKPEMPQKAETARSLMPDLYKNHPAKRQNLIYGGCQTREAFHALPKNAPTVNA